MSESIFFGYGGNCKAKGRLSEASSPGLSGCWKTSLRIRRKSLP